MSSNTPEQLAQQLVDVSIQIQQLKEQAEDLKFQIWDDATGGIQCTGGRVVYNDGSDYSRLNERELRITLRNRLHLSDQEIDGIVDSSKREGWKRPYLVVRLD
ncbi:hypothetical protein BMS3Bbin04_00072 [bacterium BMS3Bbin04]|nr:hypothetical protein BMS3Bbin04_00072 [bacterium BMS3Bbin04]